MTIETSNNKFRLRRNLLSYRLHSSALEGSDILEGVSVKVLGWVNRLASRSVVYALRNSKKVRTYLLDSQIWKQRLKVTTYFRERET